MKQALAKAVGRRGFLGGLVASPVVAREAVAEVVDGRHGAGVGVMQREPARLPVNSDGRRAFTLKEWLEHCRSEYQDESDVVRLDPDVLEMRVPLATKVRMQNKRNLERHLRHQEKVWWRRAVGGVMEWYV